MSSGNADKQRLIDLFRSDSSFRHVIDAEFIFVANEINHLTALCSPSLRVQSCGTRLDYDLCLIVLNNPSEIALKHALCQTDKQMVALPRTIPVAHSRDMLIDGAAITEWLRDTILCDLVTRTCDANEALGIIQKGEDDWIERFKRVYRNRFEERIIVPLKELVG